MEKLNFKRVNHNWFFSKKTLLLVGVLLILLSDMPGSSGIFAWFMPIPFLLYVANYKGVKNYLFLLLSLLTGFIFTLLKASSDPFAFAVAFAVMSGVVTGIRYFIVFIIWGYIRKKVSTDLQILAFPALVVSLEFMQAFFTPLGDWGALANTQLYNLPLLQTASLTGFLGISALVAWVSVLLAVYFLKGNFIHSKIHLLSFIVVFTSLMVFGDLRLNTVPDGKQIPAAAITSNYKFTGALPNPNDPEVLKTNQDLINRTRKAAHQGAHLIVWGEGSTIVSEKGEKILLDSLSGVARADHTMIVAAYALIPERNQEKGYQFINKYTWISNDGKITGSYLKHHPVPGEGSKKGIATLQLIKTEYGNMTGAICYDYDFPSLALKQSNLGADLVALPGLDWRGMLRRHTLMTRIRTIEGGFSLLRAANGATSMGFDNLGQIRAAMTDFGNNNKIMFVSLPVERTHTLYSRIGNLFAYLALFTLLVILIKAWRNSIGKIKLSI